MFLNEVLQLDKIPASIKKIDLFLSECDKKIPDYFIAFSYRAIVNHTIGRTNDALKALYGFVPDFPHLPEDAVIAVCDAIIDITIDVGRVDQAKKYIELKKNYLKVSRLALYSKDIIKYYLACKDTKEAIYALQQYLNDDVTLDEQTWALEQLSKIYYEQHQYHAYLEVIPRLENIYQECLNIKSLQELMYSKIWIAYEEGNYVRAICDANNFLNEQDGSTVNQVKVATILIQSYLKSKDYRRAAIIESNYEEFIDHIDPKVALEFARAALELYTQTNSLISIKQYQDIVKKLEQAFKTEKGKAPKTKKSVVIPMIQDDEEVLPQTPILERVVKDDSVPQMRGEVKNVRTVYISQAYEKLSSLFKTLNTLNPNTKFRELFRIACIELTAFVDIEEVYLLFYQQGYQGLHYKKERAYDKKVSFDAMQDTINFLAIHLEQEIYLDEDSKKGLNNILTGNFYDVIPHGVAFPLYKEDVAFASIGFFSSNPFLQEDMVYEVIKLVSQMLNVRLLTMLHQSELEISNRRMFFIYEKMSSGVKEMMDDHIHLSKQAVEMLGCLEDLTVADFETHIEAKELAGYRACIEEVYRSLDTHKSYEYHFRKDKEYIKIKESFYPSYDNGMISMYSLLEDVSVYEKTQNELIHLAYTHPTSKLPSELKLFVDLKEALESRKFSLVILDVMDFKLYSDLYGINFANQLIYAIAQELKSVFAEDQGVVVYHLESNHYALLLNDMNDKRTVDALLNPRLERVTKKLKILNSRVTIYFNCGVYRVSKNSSIMEADKIYFYANDALNDAKRIKDQTHHIAHFDSDAAKRRFNENQLITHISEAIDHGKLGIAYQQVADIKTGEIYAYNARLSLDNFDVDESYMNQVIQRRGLEELLDKYAISNASKELKMLKESLKAILYIFIRLSSISMTETLIPFVEQQQHFYKTTKQGIVFIVEDGSSKIAKKLRSLGYLIGSYQLMDLYQENLDFFLYDISQKDSKLVPELKELCIQKHANFVVGGMESKEDIMNMMSLDVPYVFGNYYKKTIRIKKLIDKLQN